MITIKEFPEKQFSDISGMFLALRENKGTLIAQKKMQFKKADSVFHRAAPSKETSNKASQASEEVLKRELVINTTKVMDSHSDVHLDGIWNKSIKEKKNHYLLQEHKMSFSNIISEDVSASLREMEWKDLGADYQGNTEALVFSANIDRARNPFMHEQYSKGYVNNHSVGMQYVKMELAMNSDNKADAEEKAVWDKYINEVANKSVAEEQGYFWAIHEAKIIEGSAVPIGSNPITPTLETKEAAAGTSEQIGAAEALPLSIFNYL